jgi:hypothetical protein
MKRPDLDTLIGDLADDLTPVRPLAAPGTRALIWLAAVVALTAVCAWFGDLPALGRRLVAQPDMWLALLGSTTTAVLAAFAAFQLSLPDRSSRWAWLPLPAALLWVGASGIGCLRSSLIAGTHAASPGDQRDCLLIIIGLSLPLAVLLVSMLRKGCPAYPSLVAVIAGLAAAAAAATLLNFFHPFDATGSDLAVHAVAVLLVIAATRWSAAAAWRSKFFDGAM